MPQLVLIRHGQSAWNLENRFTGWWDVDVTAQGAAEARAGRCAMMAEKGLDFDLTFTSLQTRAIKTLNLALETMGRLWLPTREALAAERTPLWRPDRPGQGGDGGQAWRRAGEDLAPQLRRAPPRRGGRRVRCVERYPLQGHRRAADGKPEGHDRRVLPYWEERIAPALRDGNRVLISAHGNSLRALVKHLSNIPDDEITGWKSRPRSRSSMSWPTT